MVNSILHRALAICGASIMLAPQAQAQSTQGRDSLALIALNRAFHLLPVELSIDLSRGVLIDSVADITGLAVGYDHEIWGRHQRGNSVSLALAFRRDSTGGSFGGHVTRRARVESVEVAFETNSAASAALILPQFRDASLNLGPPQFCNRDTLVNDRDSAIVIVLAALWRRDDATVTLNMTMNVMEPLDGARRFAPRFYVRYGAMRSSDDLFSGKLPARHDSSCTFTDDELREHGTPLDSAGYESWRRRLRPSPQ
ncbi:MAG: hypothetical protein H7099_05955 [Gemmatimonadaceae bacterium]|nr:hypothetical protein [Gemmatimonadaceae bacterium]